MDTFKNKSSQIGVRPYLTLQISLKFLPYIGTWSLEQYGIIRFIFTLTIFSLLPIMLGSFFFSQIINIAINWDDITKLASGTPVFLSNFAHILKFITINWKRRKIQELLSVIESPVFSKNNSRYKNIVTWYTWQNIFHFGIYQVCGLLCVICWAFKPITTFNENEKQLPLDGWYPYDITKSGSFMLTLVHQWFASLLCCINNEAIDGLLASLLNFACCQFEMLKWNIVAIGNETETENGSENLEKNVIKQFYNNNNVKEDLRKCINHNLAILNFVNDFQDIFSAVIGFQLFINCFVICFSTFYLSQLTTFAASEVMGTSAYAICMAYQSFIYCWNGNELYLQNENLKTAIYMGNWWKFNSRYKRDLQIVMLRTFKPLILSTELLLNLSIPTFVSIIQTSYSIFTLLHKISDS